MALFMPVTSLFSINSMLPLLPAQSSEKGWILGLYLPCFQGLTGFLLVQGRLGKLAGQDTEGFLIIFRRTRELPNLHFLQGKISTFR